MTLSNNKLRVSEVLPPHNITISNILDSSALISWDVHANNDDVKAFGLLHSKIGGNSKTITDLDKGFLSYALLDLHPSTEYLVYMWAVSEDGESVPSETRQFTTESTYTGQLKQERRYLTAEEIFFLTVVMVIWMMVLVLFFRQWGAIRDMQPHETQYRNPPANMKSVEVVKNTKDSVIYHVRHPKRISKQPIVGGATASAAKPDPDAVKYALPRPIPRV
ncbi:fibronectin type III domain-containing protein 5b-like [Saccoglossus kowalevskii]|uniref:Fibronectin type III domain-containing protein 5-like n=1 Tax=Saccoglossus kowalevskii TaxID=10224 RepID=A0ABM0MPA2_SACKO|nr:PREDICTED: fibronectin type III domain-containing protein 5-like [Saccoglossus kowalevskii]